MHRKRFYFSFLLLPLILSFVHDVFEIYYKFSHLAPSFFSARIETFLFSLSKVKRNVVLSDRRLDEIKITRHEDHDLILPSISS